MVGRSQSGSTTTHFMPATKVAPTAPQQTVASALDLTRATYLERETADASVGFFGSIHPSKL